MIRLRVLLPLVAATLGCAIDANPPPAPQMEELLRAQLGPALAPGAVELAWLGNFTNKLPSSANDWTIAASPVPGGALLRVAGGAKDQQVDAFFRVTAGALAKVTGAATVTGPASLLRPVVTAIGQDALVKRCANGVGALEVLRGATLSLVDDGARFCATLTLFGPSHAADRVVSLRFVSPTSIELQVLRLQGQALLAVGAPSSFALPAENQGPQWFGELADGVLGAAWLQGDPWRFRQGDGTERTVASPGLRVAEVRKVGGLLQVIGADTTTGAERWVAWDVQGDLALRDAGALPALPDGSARAGWSFGERLVGTLEKDARDPNVTFVSAITLRADQGSTFALVGVPPTPCAVRDTCRLYGESSLLGVLGSPEGRLGVYAVWGWNGAYLVYAAPFAARAIP